MNIDKMTDEQKAWYDSIRAENGGRLVSNSIPLCSVSVVSDSPNITTRQANRPVFFVMSRKQNTAALFEASCFEHLQAMFRVGIALPDGTHADGIGRCRNASQFAIKCARGGTQIQWYDSSSISD